MGGEGMAAVVGLPLLDAWLADGLRFRPDPAPSRLSIFLSVLLEPEGRL